MIEKYTHYGINVVYQIIDTFKNNNFRQELKENGIAWTDLPILDTDVLTYVKDGITKYACIKKGAEYAERVYITESVPLDMDWNKLIYDCDCQSRGSDPMPLKTKAKTICEAAEKMALDKAAENLSFFDMPKLDPKEFNIALIHLGYSLQDIKDMDCHDIDDDFLSDMEL